MKPALTWIQFILPEDLTHSPLQLATLQDTFGPLGEIAEIFLFDPRPEGFVFFHDSLYIPNFDGILAPQHSLIRIKNPKHSSPPICSTAEHKYPTRRPAIGTLVTLSLRGSDQYEATVVAIEQMYWPREWIYMIRIEESGKSPEFLFTILDRGKFNLEDIFTRICPKAVLLAERDVALFVDKFERPIQVTIIQQSSPGFYQTVRMVQPLLAKLSPRMIVQDIAGNRLFTANMLPSGMAQRSDETHLRQTSKSETNWGPHLTWTGPPVAIIATTTNQDRSPEPLPALSNTSQTEADHGEALELERRQTTMGGERTTLNVEESTVVIPKKRRYRGASRQKILIKWRNYTFPCTYSDLLTPATLIEDIGRNPRTSSEALAKATLTPPNNLLATLHLHTSLHMQGIVTWDILTLVVRHAKIYDPYDVQHFVAYREEDTILYFLAALRDISPIPLRSELVICHKGLPLDPASRFQDCKNHR